MSFSRRIAVLALGVVLLSGVTATATEFKMSRAEYYNPRFYGMGGAFSAIGNDRNLFFTNPAGVAYVDRNRVGFEFLPVQVNNNTFDVTNFFVDNRDTFEDLENLPVEEQAEFYDKVLDEVGAKVSDLSAHLPIYLLLPSNSSGSRPHLALGVFARGGSEFFTVNGASGIPIASLNLDAEVTGVLSAGYTWTELLPGPVTAAGSAKIDHRNISANEKSLLALSSDEKLDFLKGTVASLDLGLMYEVSPRVRLSAAVFDVVSGDFEFSGQDQRDSLDTLNEQDVGKIETSLILGAAYIADRPFRAFHDLMLAIDIREPFDEDKNFWRSIHIGAEAGLGPLALRFGFFEGYPGGGFGIGPLQYAYYSNELGNFAGAKSNYTHALSLAFSFGI
jgi:hypothetical protein